MFDKRCSKGPLVHLVIRLEVSLWSVIRGPGRSMFKFNVQRSALTASLALNGQDNKGTVRSKWRCPLPF